MPAKSVVFGTGGVRPLGGPRQRAAGPGLLRTALPADRRRRLTLAASLLSIALGLVWHTPMLFAVIAVILAALTVTLPGRA